MTLSYPTRGISYHGGLRSVPLRGSVGSDHNIRDLRGHSCAMFLEVGV